MKKQIFRNLGVNCVMNLLRMALGFLLVPFLIRKLGKEAYGLIVVAETAVVFFDVATASVWTALSRYVTFALVRGKKEGFREYLATGKGMLWAAAALAASVGAFTSWNFTRLFRVPPAYGDPSRVLFAFIAAGMTITVLNMVHRALLYAQNRNDLLNLATGYGVVLRAAALFGLFSVLPRRFVTLPAYGMVYLAMSCAQNAAVVRWSRRSMPDLRVRLRDFRWSCVKEIMDYASSITVGRLSIILNQDAANILINLFWGSAANAIYSVSLKFPLIVTRLFEEASWSLTSSFNQLVAMGDRERIRRLYFMYTKVLALISMPVCFLLVLGAGPLIHVWVGDGFAQAGKIMPILVVPMFLQLPLSVGGCLMIAHAKVRIPSFVGIAGAVANLVLSVVLGKFMGLGLTGVAASTALMSTLYFLCFSPIYVCRISGFSSWEYLSKTVGLPLLWAGAVVWGADEALRALWAAGHPVFAVVSLPGAAAFYAAGAYLAVLNREEKTQARELIGKMRGAVGRKLSPGARSAPAGLVRDASPT